MTHMLLSISGHDRPGIVRDVAEALLHLHANIEDSSMAALRGRFAMMLVVALPEGGNIGELKAALADLEQRTGLTVQSQPMTDEEAGIVPPEPDHVVTVHGADKPGIVHAVTDCLAGLSVSIVDLSTRIGDDREKDGVYMMALEVAAGDSADGMHRKLAEVEKRLGVDIEVHELETDIL